MSTNMDATWMEGQNLKEFTNVKGKIDESD